MSKLDISSTAIEKGIDLVKGFVEKLAGGAIEEAGLLMADKIRLRRLKNQIAILDKAQKIAKDSNIDIKQINLKLLVPLLEHCSLEENETLQGMWANLISSYANSNNNYESSAFPFMLSQISPSESKVLEQIYISKLKTHSTLNFNEIELNNLSRLGLVEVNKNKDSMFGNFIPNIGTINLTELGKLFMQCCTTRS